MQSHVEPYSDPESFQVTVWRTGAAFIAAVAAFTLAATFVLAWHSPEYLFLIPTIIIGLSGAAVLFRYPSVTLPVLLAGVVLTLDFEPGFQLTEIVYGAFYVFYLSFWFVNTLLDPSKSVLRSWTDALLAGFLIYVVASLGLTFLYGGDMTAAASELAALSMLGIYFPVRDYCRENKNGTRTVVRIVVLIGVFVAIRNLILYVSRLGNAEHLYQIVTGRVMLNDNVLMVASIAAFVVLLFSESFRKRIISLLLFLFIFSGLIFTQSRTFWVAFAFASTVLLFIVEVRYKRRVIILVGAGVISFVAAGALFFGDMLGLILASLIERLATIGSAAESDISLRSRGYEALAALEHIRANPILGHGVGVSFEFFDIIEKVTKERTFIHNAYVSLLYRFGLIGIILLMSYWIIAIKRSVQVARSVSSRRILRIGGLISAVTLISFLLSANASNPFFLMDALFMFGVLTGLGSGTYERWKEELIVQPLTGQ